MPSDYRQLVSLRGTEQYAAALERLLRAARKAGVQVTSRHELAAVALAEMGFRLGVRLPRRAPPIGTNRHGEPRAAAD